MKKGAVPIPYIIALLLGIAVVAILGFWFFVMGNQWGTEVTIQGCRRKAHTYCNSWKILGYSGCDDATTNEAPSVGWFSQSCVDLEIEGLVLQGEEDGDCEDQKEACKTFLTGS